MAYTLNELAKVARTPYDKAVVQDLLRQSKILQLIPIVGVNALKKGATRWQTLPTVSTRKLNASYPESTGTLENVEDTLHLYGGDIKIDRIFTMVQADESPLVTQTKMKIAAVTARFNNDVINGDHAVDPDSFEGLRKRVTNQPARMRINLADGAGDSLKVLANNTNQNIFVDALHEALHKVSNGGTDKGNVIMLMNENTYLGIGKVLRRLGLLSTVKDQYDRVWDTFAGAKLVDIGLQADQTTEIISNTEDPGDGGNDATSIYVCRLGSDDGLHLMQLNGTTPVPYDPVAKGEGGTTNQGPAYIRRIDWAIGLRQVGRYAVARIYGFRMAAT